MRWARDNVRPASDVPFGDDQRWTEAAERLGISEAVSAAGYAA